jgi:hypothetical protein
VDLAFNQAVIYVRAWMKSSTQFPARLGGTFWSCWHTAERRPESFSPILHAPSPRFPNTFTYFVVPEEL